VVIGTY